MSNENENERIEELLRDYDKLVGLLIENHFVETSPYETVKHLIETHQDYLHLKKCSRCVFLKASE
jgi:hypothetical protein